MTQWLRTSEAAARLGRSRQWILQQVNEGLLAAQVYLPPGGERRSYRIAERDLQSFARESLGLDRSIGPFVPHGDVRQQSDQPATD